MKEKIIAFSQSIGINQIGFTNADAFFDLKEKLEKQIELGFDSGFEESDLNLRTDPQAIMADAKTLIAIAIAYPSKMKKTVKNSKESPRGVFGRASWGLDYHLVLKEKLEKLAAFIQSLEPTAKCLSMVDTGTLVDRAVAERSGIGWSGKNCAIISPTYGSYIYLGELITNLELPIDTPIENQCGNCQKCLDACPTKALVASGEINAGRCLAFLTQTKTEIPEQFIAKLGNRLYGCDTCQVVCPVNKGLNHCFHKELEPDPELAMPKLLPLLTLTNRQFKEKFGKIAGAWRGRTPIQRNAILGLAFFKTKQALPILGELMDDPREVIRETASYAIRKINEENE